MRYAYPVNDEVILAEGNTTDVPSDGAVLFSPDFDTIAALPEHYRKIDGGIVVEKTQAEKDTADAARLAELKIFKQQDIDQKTGELIGQGWAWNGKVFSASSNAQRYWLGLKSASELLQPADYPLEVNTLDDQETYDIADQTELLNMFATLFGTVKAQLAGGTALKKAVRATTTKAGLDAVVDNR